ncbi:EAL domain-containing protein, partial [Raoultella sp. 18083]
AICAAIIAMGHSLGLHVLAEGVETPEQLAFLHARGCDRYQGYLCRRPVPATEFAALLAQQAAQDDSGG